MHRKLDPETTRAIGFRRTAVLKNRHAAPNIRDQHLSRLSP